MLSGVPERSSGAAAAGGATDGKERGTAETKPQQTPAARLLINENWKLQRLLDDRMR